jgi:hypothetical protein
MALYECAQCGMAVKTSCGTCDTALIDDVLVTDAGVEVRIARCPNDHGKIKSPLCCGSDMSCHV